MRMLLAALLLELAGTATAAEPLDALLARISRPVPASTVFVEQRSSALLEEPLLLRGRLARPDPGTLVREVDQPWRETTTIASGQVRVEREGRDARRFALRNAPELEALLASFHGLLSGDRALLERHYRLELVQDGQSWQLSLVPRASRLSRKVASVRLSGRADELRCMEIVEADGDASRMLLAGAAEGAGDAPPFDSECAAP